MGKKANRETTKAKPAAKSAEENKPGPKPKAEGRLPNLVSIRGKPEWREWLVEFAQHCRTDAVGAIDRALAEMARREGFRNPPPRT